MLSVHFVPKSLLNNVCTFTSKQTPVGFCFSGGSTTLRRESIELNDYLHQSNIDFRQLTNCRATFLPVIGP